MMAPPEAHPTPEVRFSTQDRTGGFDFCTSGGQVCASIFATSPNPDDFSPLDHASVSTTPDEAEAIGHAWIAWARQARKEQRTQPLPTMPSS